MSLALYHKKRDLKRSREPGSGKKISELHRLTFVVQKHNARKLHYDLRLELDGVLKSWAVPKGPSMVAGEKRLAVMVEDHPLDYGRFYGEIPQGNYGAGKVEIWDKGTYKPSTGSDEPEKTLRDMLAGGDIKFTLSGSNLKGKFALFRLNDGENENHWMLVKKGDEFSQDTYEIESILPLKSGTGRVKAKTMKSNSTNPFPDPPPLPMLAKLSEKLPDHPSWFCEMKLDGFRIICSSRNRKPDLISRNGKKYNREFSVLLDDLGKIEENIILDGEVVVEDNKGRSDFQLLQDYTKTLNGNLKYYVFDILYLDGHDVAGFPLRQRRELLDAFFGKYHFERVLKLEYQAGNAEQLFKRLSGQGFEGIIIKDPESRYLPGKRSDSWLKIKAVRKQEAVICGYTAPRGSRKYFGSLILGCYEGSKLRYAGNCGTGFTDASLKDLYERFRDMKTGTCSFESIPELTGPKVKMYWLKPELVASIKFQEWTRDGLMRIPVFEGIREDKNARDVTVEKPGSSNRATGSEMTLVISGRKVKLTNLTKIYWEDDGYTKGDLVAYYREISGFILPYLRERPQSLNRHPGGVGGKSFYHKDMDPELLPGWVKTARMDSGSHEAGVNYLICNDTATLLYMINLGCIEINPWHSSYRKPDYPYYIVLDLDPGKISFSEVVNTALAIKEICDEINIPCYPKTSGATGMHIYIPLGARYDYDQARTFAEILASLVHNRLPSATSLERAVSKREDKVYIDFLQNRKGQTITAPYSVRPVAHAVVSAPLAWKEVRQELSPEMFTIMNMVSRLGKVGDLFKPVLTEQISLTKALNAIEKLI